MVKMTKKKKWVPDFKELTFQQADQHETINFIGAMKVCGRGPLSSLPEKGQYELNFGK